MKSTSLHNYNADRGLNRYQKILYLFLNWLNNLFPYSNLDERIRLNKFNFNGWQDKWPLTYKDSSVARKFSDLFWMSLPWKAIEEELNKINVFDTGCGSGNYGARLFDSSLGAINSYTGVDAKERSNWGDLMSKYKNFLLIKSSSNDISSIIPQDTNLFITQTAIEHFDNDLSFFEQIKAHIEKSNKPSLQIHIFPAAATLPLYFFHGLRQYTPRNISKITRIFGNNSKFILFGLGGGRGKRVHFKYFTWPVLITRKFKKPTFDAEQYDVELKKAFEADVEKSTKSPIFWALIIHTNSQRKIW